MSEPLELEPVVYDYTNDGKAFEEELMRAMLEPIDLNAPPHPNSCGTAKLMWIRMQQAKEKKS